MSKVIRRVIDFMTSVEFDACDYPEDAPYENGSYLNRCVECQRLFVGHKRRVFCKVCEERQREKVE